MAPEEMGLFRKGHRPPMPTQRYGVTSYDPLRVEQGASGSLSYPLAASSKSVKSLVPSARRKGWIGEASRPLRQ